jgi:glycosyltransferase involved in cell wall biosynthesis
MRIAVLSTPFIRVPPSGYGGTELFCWELSEELATRGHEVTLYTTGDSVTRCSRRALYHRAEWPPTPHDDVNHVAWAFNEIAHREFDLVQLNSSLGVPFSRFVSVPIVHTIHHHREEAISRLFSAHPRVVYVAVSGRQLALETPLARSAVIHHGVSPDRYAPSLRDEGYLLHLGRYAVQKGTHLAIDAARLAGIPLKLAGRTHAPDVTYFAQEIRPRLEQEGVEELGEVEHDRKVALLRGARALLCPLQWEEPFGLVAIEAMLCGTPVIGFPRGSFPEIIDEGVTGFLVEDGDVTAMARVAASLERFDRAACTLRARRRFSTQVMTNAYERLYERIVRSPMRVSTRSG